MTKSLIPTEHQEQSLVIQYCNLKKYQFFIFQTEVISLLQQE